jgi:hypothetical protein
MCYASLEYVEASQEVFNMQHNISACIVALYTSLVVISIVI